MFSSVDAHYFHCYWSIHLTTRKWAGINGYINKNMGGAYITISTSILKENCPMHKRYDDKCIRLSLEEAEKVLYLYPLFQSANLGDRWTTSPKTYLQYKEDEMQFVQEGEVLLTLTSYELSKLKYIFEHCVKTLLLLASDL